MVRWKRNIFLILTGGAGKAFVDEVARLFQSYADNDAIEPISMKACIVIQVLLLQKKINGVKERFVNEANRRFEGTNIIITTKGARHLGAALGSSDFKEEYVKQRVSQWYWEIENLASIASSQPHATFAASTHGEQHEWSFLRHTVPGISD